MSSHGRADGKLVGSSSSRSIYVSGHHKSYVSQSGLVAVLQHVREHGLPEAISRRTCKRERSLALPTMTPCGPFWGEIEVEMLKGHNKKYPAINPMALLWFMCATCAGFTAYFAKQISKYPPSVDKPWDLYIYSDEILPGNALKVQNQRKLCGWYWSMGQLDSATHDEDWWFHICAIRVSEIKKIKSGVAQVFKQIVETFFRHPYSIDKGVQLPLGEQRTMWFGRMTVILGDEVALKNCLSFKGAAGSLPCPLCRNVAQHQSDLANHDHSGRLIPHTEPNTDRMVLHTDQSIQETMNHLKTQHPILNKSAFENLEKSLGLIYQPQGALYDAVFHSRFVGGVFNAIQFDWMHCYLVGGALNHEIGLLMEALASVPFSVFDNTNGVFSLYPFLLCLHKFHLFWMGLKRNHLDT